MNNKIIKQSLAYMLFFSIGGVLSGCQVVGDFFSEGQDTGYDYVTVKRKANVAPTAIYRDNDSSYRQSSRSTGTRSNSNYNARHSVNSGTTNSGGASEATSTGSMNSSIPAITKPARSSKPAGAIVPTEAPAVPSMAPTFAR